MLWFRPCASHRPGKGSDESSEMKDWDLVTYGLWWDILPILLNWLSGLKRYQKHFQPGLSSHKGLKRWGLLSRRPRRLSQGDQDLESCFIVVWIAMQLGREHNSDPNHEIKRASLSLEEVNLGQMKGLPASHSRTGFREFIPQWV